MFAIEHTDDDAKEAGDLRHIASDDDAIVGSRESN
jgi:hypothetical protein